MILIFGGTTEGRAAVNVIEEAGKPYYYSTKGDEQDIYLHYGIRLSGAMTRRTLKAFCRQNDIRLLIDAAHPFAEKLHDTVTDVAHDLGIPCIRYERIYDRSYLNPIFEDNCDPDDLPFKFEYDNRDLLRELKKEKEGHRFLFLTGVQSIARFKSLWTKKKYECYFRILDRDSSREIARQAGFPEDHLVYYHPETENLPQLLQELSPQAVVLKESGKSGGFTEKKDMILEYGATPYILLHPELEYYDITVDGVNSLRRTLEKMLPDYFPLRSGLTTGSCAAAAAIAAFRKLKNPILEDFNRNIHTVLPSGETIEIPCQSVSGTFSDEKIEVSATVIKDGGDDPDVTSGLPIVTTLTLNLAEAKQANNAPVQTPETWEFVFHGGPGVGTVTLPGLGLEVGGPAINATPRQMIIDNLRNCIRYYYRYLPNVPIHVTISVPGGEEVAARTFNPRLGVVGGISIIGASGTVKPFSSEAFVRSIRKEMEVARATGACRIVINSGAKSEKYIRNLYPELPPQAFVHYGNFIGETIGIAAELGISRLTLGVMMGKAVKLAEGHLDTHSKKVTMNKEFLKEIARRCGCTPSSIEAIDHIILARELWNILPETELQAFCSLLIEQCHRHCDVLLPNGELTILLITEEGKIIQ